MKENSSFLLSILIPVYNEQDTIKEFFRQITPVRSQLKNKFNIDTELIFTDNRSTDQTFPLLQELADRHERVRFYRFSQNVGFQRSILSGYALANGDACVQIDCDLEDPPTLIIKFVEHWLKGAKVVYGVRKSRVENVLMRIARGLFYRIIDSLSDAQVPNHAGDFRLIDRRIIDIICSMNDTDPYLRGIIASLGFDQVEVAYNRNGRFAGKSSFTVISYFSMAINGVVRTSVKPLYVSIILSMASIFCSTILALCYLFNYVITGVETSGFLTIILVILVQTSLIMFVLSIISIYIAQIFQQVLKRPISIVSEASDLNNDEEATNIEHWPGEPPLKGSLRR